MASLYRDPYAAVRAIAAGRDPAASQTIIAPEALAPDDSDYLRAAIQAEHETEARKAYDQGLQNIRASAIGAKGLIRGMVASSPEDEASALADLQRSQRISQQAAELGPRVQNFDQVHGVGDFGEYLGNLAAGQAPNIALTLGTGLAGGALRAGAAGLTRYGIERAVGAAAQDAVEGAVSSQVRRSVLDRVGERVARSGLGRRVLGATEGATLAEAPTATEAAAAVVRTPKTLAQQFEAGMLPGATAGGALLESGETSQGVLDPNATGSLQERSAKAAIGALGAGFLEALPEMKLLKRYGLGGAAEEAVSGTLLQRIAKQAGKQSLTEGGTELAQSVIERATHKWVNNNVDLLGPEAYSDYLNSAAGGFFAGGLFGAPSGIRGAGATSEGGGRFRAAISRVAEKLSLPTAAVQDATVEEPGGISQALSRAKDFASGAVAGVKEKAGSISEDFKANLARIEGGDVVSHAASILDTPAQPFDTGEVNGTATVTGAPMGKFVDGARAKAYRAQGIDTGLSAVMATLPEEHVDALYQSGALGTVTSVMKGGSLEKANSEHLQAYYNALPDTEAKAGFLRTVATLQSLDEGGHIQRNEQGQATGAQVTDLRDAPAGGELSASQQETMTEEQPLRDTKATAQLVRGAPALVRSVRANPATGFVVRDAKGVERGVAGSQLGKAISQVKADSDFQDNTRTMSVADRNVAALAQVVADAKTHGLDINVADLKPGLQLGKGWVLTARDAQRLQAGAAPTRALRTGKPAGPVQEFNPAARQTDALAAERNSPRAVAQRERDLLHDPGAVDPSEIEQTATGESAQPDAEQRILAPRTGRPAETRVSDNGKLTEAQPQDAGTIDREALRQERTAQHGAPERIAKVDAKIKKLFGKAPTDWKGRHEQVLRAIKTMPVGERLTALASDARDMHNAVIDAQRRKVKAALEAWREDKNPTTRAALAEAQEKASRSIARTRARIVELNKAEAAAKRAGKVETKNASTADATVDKAAALREALTTGVTTDEARTALSSRSLPELTAARKAIIRDAVNGLTPELEARLDAINNAIDTHSKRIREAGGREVRTMRGFDKTTAAFDKAFNDLKTKFDGKAPSLEELITATLAHASERQRALLQKLLDTGVLRGVPVDISFDEHPNQLGIGTVAAHVSQHLGDTESVTAAFRFTPAAEAERHRDIAGVVLHEAIHAATMQAEFKNPTARRQLSSLLAHARAQFKAAGIDPDSYYGLSDTQEFLAEIHSNEDLRAKLASMPPMEQKGAPAAKNLLEQFKQWVARTLGLSKPAQVTALSEAMDHAWKLVDEQRALRDQAVAEKMNPHTPEGMAVMRAAALNATSGSQPSDYMAQLGPRERLALEAAFRSPANYREILASLPADKQAQLNTADEGPTLLVNTGIALALQGKLKMPPVARSAVQDLYNSVRAVLQVPPQAVYARQIINDIKNGASPASIDVQKATLPAAVAKIARTIDTKVKPAVEAFATNIDARMRKSGIPAMTQLATLFNQRTGERRSDGAQSYTQRVQTERSQRLNKVAELLDGWDEKRKEAALNALQTRAKTADADKVRTYLKDMADYLRGAGLSFGKTTDYFPVSMDRDAVTMRENEYRLLLAEPNLAPGVKAAGGIDKLVKAATEPGPTAQQVGSATFTDGRDPTFRNLNGRISAFIYENGTPEQIAKFASFQDKNLDRILVQYTTRGVRRAEYARNKMGDQVKALLEKAKAQGATKEQLQLANDYVDQIMGTYGQDWHPGVKKVLDKVGLQDLSFEKVKGIQSSIATYQNLRLLPLALASSLIDPLGPMVRSGNLDNATKNLRDGFRALRNKNGTDALRAMADDMGIVERHATAEALMAMYGGAASDPTSLSAKLNDMMFRVNGLDYVTRMSRLTALAAAHRFLLTHANSSTEQSKRYLQELGLKPSDIKADANGHVVRNDKVDAALQRFVNESVVRPNAGQRPAWQNDPHFQLAAQYKGYLYSFFDTIVRRAGHELKNGNPAVLAPLALYLPITAAGEIARDLVQGDGDDRDWKDYAGISVMRSGLLGPHVNLIDNARTDMKIGNTALNSVLGPTGQQLGDAFDKLQGEGSPGTAVVDALPGSALYGKW
jgi:hypothetical protein